MAKVVEIHNEPGEYLFECPGCGHAHFIRTDKYRPNEASPRWTFNMDMEKPTVGPSIKVTGGNEKGVTICHLYINNGVIQYLGDCTHKLAGQTVAMVDF